MSNLLTNTGKPSTFPHWFFVPINENFIQNKLSDFFLFDQQYLVFQTNSGQVLVTDSKCPHRMAPLDLVGKVHGDFLHCPQHDYFFASNGQAFDDKKNPIPDCILKTWPTRSVSNLIFTCINPLKNKFIQPLEFPLLVQEINGKPASLNINYTWQSALAHLGSSFFKLLENNDLKRNTPFDSIHFSFEDSSLEIPISTKSSSIAKIKFTSFGIGIFKLTLQFKSSIEENSHLFFLTPGPHSCFWHYLPYRESKVIDRVFSSVGVKLNQNIKKIGNILWDELGKPLQQNSVNLDRLPAEIKNWVQAIS